MMRSAWPGVFSTVIYASTVFAAPLNIHNVPIYLGTTAEPNIMFIIDDSGSMDWEIMSQDFSNGGRFTGSQPDGSNPGGSGSVKHRDSHESGSASCGFGSGSFYGYIYGVEFGRNNYGDNSHDCNTADDEAWRFRNADFNPLYFDPNRTYTPWSGVNSAGVAFTNMPITQALADPYIPASETIDLTQHNSDWGGGTTRRTSDRDGDQQNDGFRYYTWQDANSNGRFDNGEQTEYLIKNQDTTTQQNFANWFSYYRSRQLVAKAAYGKVIADAQNVRMGLVTLHNNNLVNSAILTMNSDPATGNKRELLDALYQFRASGGTPLRNVFYQSCKYLECVSNSLFGSCPRLESADGGACQQNFAIIMTDGFYNGGFSLGNKDGDNNSAFDGGAFADIYQNTLADIAMHFYERDIQTDIDNNVPVLAGVDEADQQHVVTYTVAFGVEGTVSVLPTDPAAAFVWPNPQSGSAQKIDDLLHAAYNGRGKHLTASNAQQLSDSLNDTIADIGQRTSSASAVALNSGSLKTDTLLYQARFDSGTWSGQVLYYPLNSNGLVGAPLLDAGEVLNGQTATDRTLITWNPEVNGTGQGVAFRWGNLTDSQKTALNTDPDSSTVDNEGEDRLNFLRGDPTHEGTGNGYRDRSRTLGDIVHSTPVYVGPPNSQYKDTFAASPYSTFRANQALRRKMVYVGANDGILHGFDAESGQEVLGYVPNVLYADLAKLSSSNYSHRYYIDGTPTMADVHLASGWRTLLVTGLRGGGKAYFALDITQPALFTEGGADQIALWEYTAALDPDLGYSFSDASIIKLANGQWGVVFGNGYNSCSALPMLIILDARTGAIITKIKTDGSNYAQSNWTTATCNSSAENPNGLTTPAVVDVDGDRVADYVYAGDLEGKLWRFDLSAGDASSWNVSWGAPLFQATNSSSVPQPITTKPMIGFHPQFPSETGYLIYFGTGKYLEVNDNIATGVITQSFYAIWDEDQTNAPAISRANLLQQKILAEVVVNSNISARVTSDPQDGSQYSIDWAHHKGWYMDLINTQGGNSDNLGEKMVTNPVLKLDRIIFTTLMPNTKICGFGGGGWLMELDARDGSRLDFSILDLNEDEKFDANDQISISLTDLTGSGDGSVNVTLGGVGGSNSGIPSAPNFIDIPGGGGTSYDSNSESTSSTPNINNGWMQRHQQAGQTQERIFLSNSQGEIPSFLQNDSTKRLGRINWQQLR